MAAIDEFKNPDGTYDGIKMLAKLTGKTYEEVEWLANRFKELMVTLAMPKEDAKKIVLAEWNTKPWEKNNG